MVCTQHSGTSKERVDVVILPADKVNATVVTDEVQYEEKIRMHLETPVFCNINNDSHWPNREEDHD